MKSLILIIILMTLTGCGGFKAFNSHLSSLGSSNNNNLNNFPDLDGKATADSRLRLVGRHYVSSKLNDIFGASATAATSTLVQNEVGNFGGPCDRYRREFVHGAGNLAEQNMGDCKLEGDSQSSLIGVSTPARQAIISRVCNRILQNDAAVTNALNQAQLGNAQSRRPTAVDIQAIYDLFYPGKTAIAEVTNAYLDVSKSAESKGLSSLESWRFVLLTFCLSPDWHIP